VLSVRAAVTLAAISLFSSALILLAKPARSAERVGSDSCAACHPSAYRLWKASPHAKASANLPPAQRENLRCAYCHAPELARATQEAAPFQKPERSAGRAEEGVGCEACHGAGQHYSPSYVMRDPELARAVGLLDPGQKSCLKCHDSDSPSLSPFDFAAKVKLIDHWSRERSKSAEAPPPAGAAGGPILADTTPAKETPP